MCSHDCCLCHTAFYHSSHLYHFWFRCCAIVCVRYTNIACGLTIPTIYQFQFVGFLLWAARIRFICWLIKYYEPLTFEVSPVHCLKECETRNVEIAESLHHMHAEREMKRIYDENVSIIEARSMLYTCNAVSYLRAFRLTSTVGLNFIPNWLQFNSYTRLWIVCLIVVDARTIALCFSCDIRS